MLSKNADTNPSASALPGVGNGSEATGISDAEATRHSRNSEPLSAPGRTLRSGRRQADVSVVARTTVTPMNGNRSDSDGAEALIPTLTATALARMKPTIAMRGQSTARPGPASFRIGANRCWERAAGTPKSRNATPDAKYACSTSAGATPLIHI